jgi:hypothetical protein
MTREVTNKLLDMIDEGLVDRDTVIQACLMYMSADEVADMCHCNEFITQQEVEDEYEEVEDEIDDLLNNFNYVGSRHHY